MNPISVIFVLVIFSGLQDYTAEAVEGNYDPSIALKIMNCANAAYNEVKRCPEQDNFSDMRSKIHGNVAIAKKTLNSQIRSLLATDEMTNKFRDYVVEDVGNDYADEILGDD